MRTRRIGFHGTSETAFRAIREEGFNAMAGQQVWTPSAGNNYFWDLNAFDSSPDGVRSCFNNAADAALPSLLFANETEVRRVVIIADLTDLDLCEDTSFRAPERAVLVPGVIEASRIISAWRDSHNLLPIRALLASAFAHENLIDLNWQLSALERELASRFKAGSGVYSALQSMLEWLSPPMDPLYQMQNAPGWASEFLKHPTASAFKTAA